jgi:hypothetical protein
MGTLAGNGFSNHGNATRMGLRPGPRQSACPQRKPQDECGPVAFVIYDVVPFTIGKTPPVLTRSV